MMEVLNSLLMGADNNMREGSDLWALLENSVKANRYLHKRPSTLFDLSIGYLSKNWKLFVGNDFVYSYRPESNPFRQLRNTTVQALLQKIAQARKEKNFLVPKNKENSFVKLLLNRNVTDFDMQKFDDRVAFNQEYFSHLLERCPKIKRVRFLCDEDRDEDSMELPTVMEMKNFWPNLINLSLIGAVFSDQELKGLQIHFPQLEVLEFYTTNELFTMKGVKRLSKMQNLRMMHIKYEHHGRDETSALSLLAHAAGRVPNLKKFGFELASPWSGSDREFVIKFHSLYKYKELCLSKLHLKCGLKWPTNLTVETLTLEGLWKNSGVKHMCSTIKFPVKSLVIDNLQTRHIYSVVEAIGSEILELRLKKCNNRSYAVESINLYRVLAACPKLESVELACYGPVESKPKYNISPLSFVNYKEVRIASDLNYVNSLNSPPEVMKIYSMFLEGSSRNGRELILTETNQMQAIIDALRNNEKCLHSVERVDMGFFSDVEGTLLICVLKTALMLTVSCPSLKRVHVNVCHGDQWPIYKIIESEYSGVTKYLEGIGVELRFSNSYASASSSMDSSRQGSEDEDSMLSDSSD